VTTYFVVHLNERDRPADNRQFEIQLLDRQGRATACGYVGPRDARLQIAGHTVPTAVLEAARRQPLGHGDYVNEKGDSVVPF